MNGKRGLIALVLTVACLGSGIVTFSAVAADPWEGDITINSDGSVSPSDAPIKVSGKNYKLTSDIEGTITIQKDEVNLNGNGYTMYGDGDGYTVQAENVDGITVRNMELQDYQIGIYFDYVDGSKVMNNEMMEVTDGVYIMNSLDDMIVENTLTIYRFGIYMAACEDFMVTSNMVQGKDDMNPASIGIYVRHYSHNNKVNDNQIKYTDSAGICIHDNSEYNEVVDNTIEDNYFNGIYVVWFCQYNIVKDNTIINVPQGLVVGYYNYYNEILNNYVVDCYVGMYIWDSDENKIKGNYFETYPKEDLPEDQPSYGISIDYCDMNAFIENSVVGSTYAFWIDGSYDNILYHNDIVDNDYPFSPSLYGYPETSETYNTWDNGKGEGNYWFDYEGEDTDSDGIGDTDLPHAGVDYYPLMDPYN